MKQSNLTTLLRREIQSPLVAGILQEFIQEFGYDRTMEIASRAIQKDARSQGSLLAKQAGAQDLATFLRLVKEVWAAGQALEIEVLEQSDSLLRFNVNRCLFAEMYERLGIKQFGACLSCSRDAALIEGFNPRMKLERTQTIMEGASFCDFSIHLE